MRQTGSGFELLQHPAAGQRKEGGAPDGLVVFAGAGASGKGAHAGISRAQEGRRRWSAARQYVAAGCGQFSGCLAGRAHSEASFSRRRVSPRSQCGSRRTPPSMQAPRPRPHNLWHSCAHAPPLPAQAEASDPNTHMLHSMQYPQHTTQKMPPDTQGHVRAHAHADTR